MEEDAHGEASCGPGLLTLGESRASLWPHSRSFFCGLPRHSAAFPGVLAFFQPLGFSYLTLTGISSQLHLSAKGYKVLVFCSIILSTWPLLSF